MHLSTSEGGQNRRERAIRLRRQLDPDRVAGPDLAAGDDDAHDAGLADQIAVLVSTEGRCHQPRLDAVQLRARVSQARDLNHGLGSQTQSGPSGQRQQIVA